MPRKAAPAKAQTAGRKPQTTAAEAPAVAYQVMTLALGTLLVDRGIQPRLHLSPSYLTEYKTLYEEAEPGACPLPPPDVFDIAGVYTVADGFHRVEAAKMAGLRELACHVYQGTRQEAARHAAYANLRRGLAYTREDKQNILESLLTDPVVSARPDRDLAQDFGLSHVTVWRARQRLEQEARLAAQLEERAQAALEAQGDTVGGAPPVPEDTAPQVAAFLEVPVAKIERVAGHTYYQPAQVVKDVARTMVNYDVGEAEAKARIAERMQAEQRRLAQISEPRPVRRPPSDEVLARREAKKRQEWLWGQLESALYAMRRFVPSPVDEEDEGALGGASQNYWGEAAPTPEEVAAAVPPGWDSERVSEYLPQAIAVLTAIQVAWDARQTETAPAAG